MFFFLTLFLSALFRVNPRQISSLFFVTEFRKKVSSKVWLLNSLKLPTLQAEPFLPQ